MTQEKTTTEQISEAVSEMIALETKVQTIYFEDAQGNMGKYHHVSDVRLNKKEAEKVLAEAEISINLLLRTVTERLTIEMTRDELQSRITGSQRFYQSQKNTESETE